MNKVLIVLTNVQAYEGTNKATGLWLGEATEFVDAMQQADIAVDYVSPKGGFVPLDPRSMKYIDAKSMAIYNEQQFIVHALCHTLKPSEIKVADYSAIYYTGGHGVMWDFPDNKELQTIAATIYQHGGYVMSVCHGIAGLFNIKDEMGNYLITGKKITGFTKSEEILAGKQHQVPFFNARIAKDRQAIFVKQRFYKSFAVQDGRIITGQNPFSVRAVAELFINALRITSN